MESPLERPQNPFSALVAADPRLLRKVRRSLWASLGAAPMMLAGFAATITSRDPTMQWMALFFATALFGDASAVRYARRLLEQADPARVRPWMIPATHAMNVLGTVLTVVAIGAIGARRWLS